MKISKDPYTNEKFIQDGKEILGPVLEKYGFNEVLMETAESGLWCMLSFLKVRTAIQIVYDVREAAVDMKLCTLESGKLPKFHVDQQNGKTIRNHAISILERNGIRDFKIKKRSDWERMTLQEMIRAQLQVKSKMLSDFSGILLSDNPEVIGK